MSLTIQLKSYLNTVLPAKICRTHQTMFLVRLSYGDLTKGLPDFTVHDTCPWPLPPEDHWLSLLNAHIHLSESCRASAGQKKMFLVRLCHGDLTQGLPDFTVHDACPWPLPPEDRWLCHTTTESCRAGQRKMFLVRLCYRDLTQGLPDFTVHDTCQWPLPPEDRWLCHS